MHRPSSTALKARARTLLERMSDRARWIYALPPEEAKKHLGPTLRGSGFEVSERDDEARVTKWSYRGLAQGQRSPGLGRAADADETGHESAGEIAGETATFLVLDRDDLEVTLVEALGGGAVEALGALLKETGFFAQSALLESALDVATEDARKALLTLAHMVVAWDEDWADLFLLHLASPDPIVRHDAVAALAVAVMVAGDRGPAPELLDEAAKRETYPKLKETIDETRKLVAAVATR